MTVTSPRSDPSIIEDEDYLLLTNGQHIKHFFIALDADAEKYSKCNQASSSNSVSSSDLSIPFSCEATWLEHDSLGIDDVFHLDSAYVDGRPSCAFTTRDLSPERRKAVSSTERTLALSVRLTDHNSHVEYNSHRSSHIRFIPNAFITTRKMTLGKGQLTDSVDVYGSESQLSVLKVSEMSLKLSAHESDKSL